MSIEFTWRWFGPNDPISLKEVKQTGATGVVTALHQVPIGEIWTIDEINKRKQMIEAEGLTWSVAESIPIHEAIKKRSGKSAQFLGNYKQSVMNLGKCGINIVCYNFMPVLDWSRTDLEVEFRDGSITTRFESRALIAFDLFILKRKNAEKDYNEQEITSARKYFEALTEKERIKLLDTILLGFPGSEEAYTLDALRLALQEYTEIGENELRSNLHEFIREIIPAAQEAGVLMAIHPDDPPWPLLGLPRVVSSSSDLAQLLDVVQTPANGLTLCTGSLGASRKNNLTEIVSKFAHRINFTHLRNVTSLEDRNFIEDNHLEGNVDMFAVMKMLVQEQHRRETEERSNSRLPIRPDHGHLMIADKLLAEHKRRNVYPGYALFGRLRGISELRGLELGIKRSLGL